MNQSTIIIIIVSCCMLFLISSSIGGAVYYQQSQTTTPVSKTTSTTKTTAAPASSTPATTSRTYKTFANTDYTSQGDISNSPGSVTECQAKCDTIPNCKGFVTNGSNCWFKNENVNTPTYHAGLTYYYTGNSPQGPASFPSEFKPNNQIIKSNLRYNFCLEVPGFSKDNGVQMQMWDCHGKENQQFTLDNNQRLIIKDSGKCLDVKESKADNGTIVQQWECGDVNNQKWERDDQGRLRPKSAINKCLDISAVSKENGAKLQIWDCHDVDNQKWFL